MGNIHSINIGGSTYVIEPNLINITPKTSGMSYVAFFSDRRAGGRYAYSYYGAFLNNTTGELQIPHLRLKHTNGNYGSYLRFGDGNYSYIFENPDDKLNIFSSRGSYIIGGPTYISSDYTYISNDMYFYKNILPVNDSNSNIGSSAKRFSTIYVDNINADNINAAIYVTYNPTSNNTYSVPFMDYGHTKYSKIYSDNTFNYNPYTNTLTARNFAGTATNSDQVAIHTKEFIKDSDLCTLNGMYEVPVILGVCDCTIFSDQPDADYFGLMTDYHPQNNNSNWLRYNFNDQTLKSTNFEGNFIGNASTATTATNATYINVTSSSTNNEVFRLLFTNGIGNRKAYTNLGVRVNPYSKTIIAENFEGTATKINVTATSTSANYPLIFGPSDATVGGTVSTGSKSLYTDSANNLYYNPSNNTLTATKFSGNLTGRILPKTTNTTAIEMTYTGISGIEYHSNVSKYQNGNNYYAGTAYGFPVLSNANAVLNFETHPYNGASYYLHQIGFSSDNRLYHRAFHGNNPNSASSTTSNQNGKTWNSIPLCKPSNYGQVRNIEVVTSMPSTPNAYTLYLVLG